jgi:hypothetical protein
MVDTWANAFIEHKTFQVDLGKGGGGGGWFFFFEKNFMFG